MTPSPALVLPLLLLLGALPPAAAARGECWRPARRPGLRQRRPFPSGPELCHSARLARVPAPRPCWPRAARPLTHWAPSSPTGQWSSRVGPTPKGLLSYLRGLPSHHEVPQITHRVISLCGLP